MRLCLEVQLAESSVILPRRMDSRKVLDYGDVLLRQSDVDLLKGAHWLNDQVSVSTVPSLISVDHSEQPDNSSLCVAS